MTDRDGLRAEVDEKAATERMVARREAIALAFIQRATTERSTTLHYDERETGFSAHIEASEAPVKRQPVRVGRIRAIATAPDEDHGGQGQLFE